MGRARSKVVDCELTTEEVQALQKSPICWNCKHRLIFHNNYGGGFECCICSTGKKGEANPCENFEPSSIQDALTLHGWYENEENGIHYVWAMGQCWSAKLEDI